MNGVRPAAFEKVVQSFFEAAAVPALWPAALHELALACGAEGVAAHSSDGTRTFGTVGSQGAAVLYDDFLKRWRAPELNSHRVRGMALIGRGWRGAFTERHCFSPADLARDVFHQEFITPAGFPYFAGMVLAQGSGTMLSATMFRRPQQGPYLDDEIKLINMLMTHLRAAGDFALQVGLKSTKDIADALATTDQAAALLGRDGSVSHLNARFEQLLGDGVRIRNGRLMSPHAEADRSLAAAIERARNNDLLDQPLMSVVLPRRNGARALVAQIFPVVGAAHDLLQAVSAIVTLVDLEVTRSGPAASLLCQAFGLSPAQARLAGKIAAGKTLSEISRIDGTSSETLRTQLKAIFDKTGTRRQSELVLLLSKFPSA